MKIEANNLSFSYGESVIFRDVSFSVDSKDILTILGANGAGKTTLFKVLLGLKRSTTGGVHLNQYNISDWTKSKIAQHVGYVPQNHVPPFPFTVTDVVLMGRTAHLRAYQSPTHHDIRVALDAMERLHIYHLKDRSYTEISGGERQLALIARALAQEPKILIMDEPTSNLDFGNQVRILQYIKQLASEGLTIIMSSHYPNHALQYATKVALMHDKTINIIASPKDAITEKTMRDLYGIEVKILEVPNISKNTLSICIAKDI
nr:ABC transporter ATP-binding protein [uncultured Sphaerochaeta sp.]